MTITRSAVVAKENGQRTSQFAEFVADAKPAVGIRENIHAPKLAGDGALNLRTSCGAKGDGFTMHSGALRACLTQLQALLAGGKPVILLIPAGIYLIKGTNGTMPTIMHRGGAIIGDGPHESYIVLDSSILRRPFFLVGGLDGHKLWTIL